MLEILLILALALAVFFAVRYFLLRHGVKKIDEELRAIARQLEQNRIMKLPYPSKELEALLTTINKTLDATRKKAIEFSSREEELKAQIEHISHDLRTPLTAILGYLSLIDEQELGEENKESLEAVSRKAQSLQRLIAQFYELSQIRTDEGQEHREALDIGRLLRESITIQYRLLSEQGLDVSTQIPDHPVMVWASRDALERIFANLFQNAGRYAKSHLLISLEEDKGVALHFTNDLDPSLVIRQPEQLFQPFFTADNARSQEGSGLGLTIARRLAEGMGGSLAAKTVQKAAAARSTANTITFTLKLPTSTV